MGSILRTAVYRRFGAGVLAAVFLCCPVAPALAQTGSISGIAFEDIDCDGSRDAHEAALGSIKIYLRGQAGGQPPTLDSTTTNADGAYSFAGLSSGDYDLSCAVPDGYVQRGPVSVDYRFAHGGSGTMGGMDFTFRAEAGCDTVPTYCPAGVADNFDPANGSEPSSPSADLAAQMATCGSSLPFFDQPASGACFGHTFSGCWDPCDIVRGELRLGLRASAAGSQDDELLLGDWPSPGRIWGASLSHLLEIKTGGADPSWDPGDTMTLVLDLGRLPLADRGLTNVLAAVQDGDLDVFIGSETEIDYLTGKMDGG
ncbi:MAG TPA: SdrD B-like domain-containing protein [candidate division Zixibacteria bacterium]|nr:hypothetical protein [candidate division Zixibacteria bacterium]MDD4917405.1 SdrD B-like domain-containing protein [candidate division Zixibacteria bacterium]MDM7972403.1 SdrD B-like domain-containing protein [candidate division Zixibacteria bacterium]HOZ07345.1 SdrD B-like domain-containing protein [candidate division Zixibacteria bacterium]HPM36665.1 SdrD B-like domain-containing protein [candidate division Zixibacteria bacterium]